MVLHRMRIWSLASVLTDYDCCLGSHGYMSAVEFVEHAWKSLLDLLPSLACIELYFDI